MSRTINFTMGIHNHQPVGNFDYVFEEAYTKSYLPILECLERHPQAKMVLHNTGPLWDEYLKAKPQWIEKMRNLVKRGQLELLSGGYYEPILVNIADRDKVTQIKMMNKVVRRETNYKPRGMWCAERVWEPSLPRPIALSDIQYTILDESHFRAAGLEEEDMFGYYVTDEQGYAISVVPISQKLRHMMPYCKPQEVIDYLKLWADDKGNRLATFADDGEKFGVWPGSYKIIWEEGWMDTLLDLLEKNSDWIKMTTISEYMDKFPPAGRVYLPTASYSEMALWALPTPEAKKLRKAMDELQLMGKWEEYQNFCKGGFWRNFLVKYPEANRIQKKALYVSEKVQRMVTRDKTEAEVELFKGQCNCPYWHGWFGGIYLPHLRHAVQSSLIRAEQLADDELHKGNPYKEIEQVDINRDLMNEVIINTMNLQLSFSPHLGGSLYELDYKPAAINMCDTLTRQEEVYHETVKDSAEQDVVDPAKFKEKDLHKHLVYDPYQRVSFIDHFLKEDETLVSFAAARHKECGDFVEKPYEVFTSTKDDMAVLTLSRKGHVNVDRNRYAIEIEKTFLAKVHGYLIFPVTIPEGHPLDVLIDFLIEEISPLGAAEGFSVHLFGMLRHYVVGFHIFRLE